MTVYRTYSDIENTRTLPEIKSKIKTGMINYVTVCSAQPVILTYLLYIYICKLNIPISHVLTKTVQ